MKRSSENCDILVAQLALSPADLHSPDPPLELHPAEVRNQTLQCELKNTNHCKKIYQSLTIDLGKIRRFGGMFQDPRVGRWDYEVYQPTSKSWEAASPVESIAIRFIDIGVSACALLCLSPFLLVIACLIKLESPGPVVFRQVRNGKSGKTFQILKFRSMIFQPGAAFEQCRPSDTRITKLGKLLRKTSIDELLQLVNVLRGHMSLVGPRPHAVEHDIQFSTALPFYMNRYKVRPGMTGWAQIQGFRGPVSTIEDMERRLSADLQYVRDPTLKFYVWIILCTVPAMIFPQKFSELRGDVAGRELRS
jgi:putative colanic acid biosynthesis UDP-glucose lipid carrier transferase